MEIWIPFVSNSGAVINFSEPRAWDKIEAALACLSNPDWAPLAAFIGKGVPDGFVYAGGILACDSPTWRALEDNLKNEVETLSLSVSGEPYFLLHVTNIIPCLNINGSKVLRSPIDDSLIGVLHYSFDESLLENVFLFRIPEDTQQIFATSLFKTLIENKEIHNLDFQHPSYSMS